MGKRSIKNTCSRANLNIYFQILRWRAEYFIQKNTPETPKSPVMNVNYVPGALLQRCRLIGFYDVEVIFGGIYFVS